VYVTSPTPYIHKPRKTRSNIPLVCTPYLLELGLTKKATTLVWLAGPLTGMTAQPIIGVLADASTSRFGRRRPYLIISTVTASVAFMVLGSAGRIMTLFAGESATNEEGRRDGALAVAIVAIWIVDLALNAAMSCAKALVVDSLTVEMQQAGAAWYLRMAASSDLVANAVGAVDLVGLLYGENTKNAKSGLAGRLSQFEIMTGVTAVVLTGTTLVTCWAVQERVLMAAPADGIPLSLLQRLRNVVVGITGTMKGMPSRIRTICHVQFWAWLGWFPFLFYSSTWVGELYFQNATGIDEQEALREMGRVGSMAMRWYAAVTFVCSWLGPIFITNPEEGTPKVETTARLLASRTTSTSTTTTRTASPVSGTTPSSTSFTKSYRPDLLAAWIFGTLSFTAVMMFAPLAGSYTAATLIVAGCGV